MKYEVSGIKARTDYSFALKLIHLQTDDDFNQRSCRKKQIKLEYNSKRGILIFHTKVEIDALILKKGLSEKGLTLKVCD